MKKSLYAALLGGTALLSGAQAQAADTVAVDCQADNAAAAIRMDAAGAASLAASIGEQTFNCAMKLEVLEGPPFSDNMTGMLVLTFDRGSCEPKAMTRKVMPEVSLHIEQPLAEPVSGMTMVQRRPVLYQCSVQAFDLDAIMKLATGNGDIRIKTEK